MKKLILIIILIALSFTAGLLFDDYPTKLTGNTVAIDDFREYSWTRAICNTEGECLDVMIKCKEGRVTGLEPLTRIIKHNSTWADPRENNVSYC